MPSRVAIGSANTALRCHGCKWQGVLVDTVQGKAFGACPKCGADHFVIPSLNDDAQRFRITQGSIKKEPSIG